MLEDDLSVLIFQLLDTLLLPNVDAFAQLLLAHCARVTLRLNLDDGSLNFLLCQTQDLGHARLLTLEVYKGDEHEQY